MKSQATFDFVSTIMTKHNIDGYRELFDGPHYVKQTAPVDFDHLIGPFKTTRDVKQIPTGS